MLIKIAVTVGDRTSEQNLSLDPALVTNNYDAFLALLTATLRTTKIRIAGMACGEVLKNAERESGQSGSQRVPGEA